MATPIQVVIDCADPATLAQFWAAALHYQLDDPPAGFDSWPDFLRAQDVPESEWNAASAVSDPDGRGPRIYFQRVPEPKQGKNRLHLDLNVSGGRETTGEERKRKIDAEVERLVDQGASVFRPGAVSQLGEYWVIMQDPEANESACSSPLPSSWCPLLPIGHSPDPNCLVVNSSQRATGAASAWSGGRSRGCRDVLRPCRGCG